jgi:hypothetical protein
MPDNLPFLQKDPKNFKFEGIFHELYKFGIVIIFHVHVKVTRQYDWHPLNRGIQLAVLVTNKWS